MAIKDQCEKCNNANTVHCPGQIFNNSSCDSYHRIIDLEKHEKVEQTTTTTSPQRDDSTCVVTPEMVEASIKPHGWLLCFFIWFGLGAILSPIMAFSSSLWDGIASLVYAALIVYMIVAFYKKKADAVFVARIVVGICVVSNLSELLSVWLETGSLGGTGRSSVRVCVATLWFMYLCASNQVKEIIPQIKRKTGIVGWIGMCLFILCFVAAIVEGLMSVQIEGPISYSERDAYYAGSEIKMSSLKNGEYTDGRVAFMCPESFYAETIFNEDDRGYVLSNDEGMTITVISSFGVSKDRATFDETWPHWKDDSSHDYESEVVKDTPGKINGHDYFIRIEKYIVEGSSVYWRFALLFDDNTGKVCLVSGYDLGDNSFFHDVVSSIRFE